jgi:hypothetical protein
MTDLRYVQINTLHPSEDQYLDMHGVRRFDDVPADAARESRAAHEELLDRAVGRIPPALRFVYYDVFLGSLVLDFNAFRSLVGEPEEVLFTQVWPADSITPSVTTVLRHPGDLRTMYAWSYLADLRDYVEEIAVLAPTERVRVQFPSPFLKNWPTPVVHQYMAGGAMVDDRVQVSYDEAFCEELRAFHDCVVNDKQPLTDVADARADIALLQRILAAARPPGLGGEAARGGRPGS